MHRFSYTFVHGILFTHSVLQSFTHVIHDGVLFNLLRGFSHRTLTRNFGNTNSLERSHWGACRAELSHFGFNLKRMLGVTALFEAPWEGFTHARINTEFLRCDVAHSEQAYSFSLLQWHVKIKHVSRLSHVTAWAPTRRHAVCVSSWLQILLLHWRLVKNARKQERWQQQANAATRHTSSQQQHRIAMTNLSGMRRIFMTLW